jgi:hypothetical protein
VNPKIGQRAVLLLLVLYSLDFVWKLSHWGALTKRLDWWALAMALTVRFAFMGGLLYALFRLKRAFQESK